MSPTSVQATTLCQRGFRHPVPDLQRLLFGLSFGQERQLTKRMRFLLVASDASALPQTR
jgi:hypothetical protein